MRAPWLLALLLAASPALGQGITATSSAADGKPGPTGPAGPSGAQGALGPAGAPKRIERYTATTDANGVATFSWSACTATPDVQVIPGWASQQYVGGGVTAQTLTGATVQGMVSRGALLLTSGPFQPAPAGTAITVRMMC